MKAVILAAGKGVRLQPLTDNAPKAMVLLKGKPLLEHVLLSLKGAGVKDVIIVVGYLKEKIIQHFGNGFHGMRIQYAVQEQQLGTAHAIATAEKLVDGESFVCVHTDVIPDSSIFRQLTERFDRTKQFDAVVVGRITENPWPFGVLKLEGKKVIDIVEKPVVGKEPSNIINAAIYWFSPKIFETIRKVGKNAERGEFEITDSLRELAKKDKLGFVLFKGKCIDISSLAELKEAEEEKI